VPWESWGTPCRFGVDSYTFQYNFLLRLQKHPLPPPWERAPFGLSGSTVFDPEAQTRRELAEITGWKTTGQQGDKEDKRELKRKFKLPWLALYTNLGG
jgi:hypothetical protein